jgi:predicted amidohydrolase YtcJ
VGHVRRARARHAYAGRPADLAVLEEDPLTVPLTDIESLACRLTMVGGRVVHGED